MGEHITPNIETTTKSYKDLTKKQAYELIEHHKDSDTTVVWLRSDDGKIFRLDIEIQTIKEED